MVQAVSMPAGRRCTPFWLQLYPQVLLAIVLGAVVGFCEPKLGVALKPLADGFIQLVKMIIGVVIFLTLSTGLGGMRSLKTARGVAWKAFAYFLTFSTLALVVGLVVANTVQPGAGMNADPASLDSKLVADYVAKAHDQTVVGFLTAIIPKTIVGAFAEGDILPILLISILFGVSLALTGERGAPVVEMLERVGEVVFRMVAIIMRAAPVGAFGAFAFTVGKFGVTALVKLAALVGTFYLTSALFVLVVLGAVAALAGFSILKLIRYLKDELFLVLGTSSSEAALPSLMAKMEQAGCPKPVVGLVVPTGYSFNLDGTNIYMTLAALFIAQATNTHLSLEQQLLLLGVAMLSSKGAAGVTGSGFITLAATLAVVPSLPLAGMALILGVDRFMSECRSLTNFIGNAVATVVVSRWEGGLDRERLAAALSGPPGGLAAPEPVNEPED